MPLASQDNIVDRLDRILAVLQLAHYDAIQRASTEIRRDKVNHAILDACEDDWTPAATVRDKAHAATGAQTSAIKRRISDLVARRALFERGATTDRAYKASNLV